MWVVFLFFLVFSSCFFSALGLCLYFLLHLIGSLGVGGGREGHEALRDSAESLFRSFPWAAIVSNSGMVRGVHSYDVVHPAFPLPTIPFSSIHIRPMACVATELLNWTWGAHGWLANTLDCKYSWRGFDSWTWQVEGLFQFFWANTCVAWLVFLSPSCVGCAKNIVHITDPMSTFP